MGYVLLLLHQTSCNAVLGLASPQPNKGQATSRALLWALAGAGLNNRAHFAPGKQSGYNGNLYDTQAHIGGCYELILVLCSSHWDVAWLCATNE